MAGSAADSRAGGAAVGRLDWHVRPATSSETPFVADLWGQYFEVEGVPDVVVDGTDPEHAGAYCNVAVTGEGELVGAGVAAIGPRAYVRREIDLGDLALYSETGNGLLLFGGVRRGWRGRGIGTALTRDLVRWLASAGARRAFATAWVRQDASDSRSVFDRLGFTPVTRVEAYWADTPDGRPSCPDCEGRCRCDAVLYARDLQVGRPADAE